MSKVITRFPPSPTGYFHIGSARTALFNYLFAKHGGGKMVLRLEDTDVERSKKEYEEDILKGIEWLGLRFDGDVQRQSERTDIYRKCVADLIEKGCAYEAEDSEANPGKKVVRFKNPNIRIIFSDLIRGEVSFDTSEHKDFVIARTIDEPLYNFGVVVDDAEMGVTHVIRGEDHISNTGRQILILEALGYKRPEYAHIPLILAPDRSKLSKRHGAVSINEYRAQGFLPQAIVNYLALLGWNPGGDREIFTMEELVAAFDISRVQKGGAVFDIEKLKWFNAEHQKLLSQLEQNEYKLQALPRMEEEAGKRGISWSDSAATAYLLSPQTSASTYAEFAEQVAQGSIDYLFEEPKLESAKIPQKGTGGDIAAKHLAHVRDVFMKGKVEDFETADTIKNLVWDYASAEGRGAVLWPLRYALSGKEKSQDPFIITSYLGKEKAVQRIQTAIDILKK